MKRSFVLNANKEFMVLNWIKSNVWNKQDFQVSFDNTMSHESTITGLEMDMKLQDVREFLINYVESLRNDNVFNKFLERIYKTYCFRCNFKKFAENEQIPFEDKDQLHRFLINNMIGSLV
jgi:hypothetical protein